MTKLILIEITDVMNYFTICLTGRIYMKAGLYSLAEKTNLHFGERCLHVLGF